MQQPQVSQPAPPTDCAPMAPSAAHDNPTENYYTYRGIISHKPATLGCGSSQQVEVDWINHPPHICACQYIHRTEQKHHCCQLHHRILFTAWFAQHKRFQTIQTLCLTRSCQHSAPQLLVKPQGQTVFSECSPCYAQTATFTPNTAWHCL